MDIVLNLFNKDMPLRSLLPLNVRINRTCRVKVERDVSIERLARTKVLYIHRSMAGTDWSAEVQPRVTYRQVTSGKLPRRGGAHMGFSERTDTTLS